jgi:hypothetical protein
MVLRCLTNKTITNPTVTTGNFTSPVLVNPTIGAASGTSLILTGNLTAQQLISNVATGTAPFTVSSTTPVANLSIGGNAATATTVTTNANLTGPITSVGNATSVAAQTGTGSTFVMNTSPTLVTPNIGAASGTSLTTTGNLTAPVIVSNVATGTAPFTGGIYHACREFKHWWKCGYSYFSHHRYHCYKRYYECKLNWPDYLSW